MGCCFSTGDNNKRNQDIELSSTTNSAVTCKCNRKGEKVSLQHDTERNTYIIEGGTGSVLGSCALDCDTARWEIVCLENCDGIEIGIVRMRSKENLDLGKKLSEIEGSRYMKATELKNGDIVGVYWDLTDLPTLFFSVNGKVEYKYSVNKVSPSSDCYPAVSISNGSKCEVVFDENSFKFPSVSQRFQMIICATSII
jgi:hypothetical protein